MMIRLLAAPAMALALLASVAHADPGDPNIVVPPGMEQAQLEFADRYAYLMPEQARQPWEVLQIAHVVCDKLEGASNVAQILPSLQRGAQFTGLSQDQISALVHDSIPAECPFITLDPSGSISYTFTASTPRPSECDHDPDPEIQTWCSLAWPVPPKTAPSGSGTIV